MNPKLLLHICCAPDEAWVIHTLHERYKLSCFFCNPNIAPSEEFVKRKKEAERAAAIYGIPFVSDDYQPDSWENAVAPVADTPEGGERCRRCFLLRLRRSAAFCESIGFPAFTTVMSVSPHKRIAMLNECGSIAAKEVGVEYAPFDFKKKDGFRNSIILSKELGLYRQDYCGCRLSKVESERRKADRAARTGTTV
jgi:epoxyqueuosine reductase